MRLRTPDQAQFPAVLADFTISFSGEHTPVPPKCEDSSPRSACGSLKINVKLRAAPTLSQKTRKEWGTRGTIDRGEL